MVERLHEVDSLLYEIGIISDKLKTQSRHQRVATISQMSFIVSVANDISVSKARKYVKESEDKNAEKLKLPKKRRHMRRLY